MLTYNTWPLHSKSALQLGAVFIKQDEADKKPSQLIERIMSTTSLLSILNWSNCGSGTGLKPTQAIYQCYTTKTIYADLASAVSIVKIGFENVVR